MNSVGPLIHRKPIYRFWSNPTNVSPYFRYEIFTFYSTVATKKGLVKSTFDVVYSEAKENYK